MFASPIVVRHRARLARMLVFAVAACAPEWSFAAEGAPRVLTLPAAVDSALARDPSLAGARLEVGAADALARDAGRRAPLRLGAEAENWGGPEGNTVLETTVSLGWTLELGGDRGARSAGAGAGASIARADLALRRRELRAAVASEFVTAWAAQERRAVLREVAADAEGAIEAARARFKAGAAPEAEVARAESDAARVRAQLARAEATLRSARRSLAAHWAGGGAEFDSLALDSPEAAARPAESVPATHPALARAAAESLGAEAGVRVARANRRSDLDFWLGARKFRDDGPTAFVAGIELPLAAAGSGAIDAARARQQRASLERAAASRALETGASNAAAELDGALAAWRELTSTASPRAEQALALISAGYRAGRFRYVEMADGRRAALDTRVAVIEAAADVWRARAELERFVGTTPQAPAEESGR